MACGNGVVEGAVRYAVQFLRLSPVANLFLVAKYGDSQFRTAAHIHGKAIRMSMRDYVTYMAVHISSAAVANQTC